MIRKTETIWLNEVDSTNRFALENFDCFDSGTLIAASAQSAGRGSGSRSWMSPPDVNVYASLILKGFSFAPHHASRIGSLAVLTVLRLHAPGLPFSVKWPNDVLCGSKKIAGILCEANPRGIVIGIGLNINMDRAALAAIPRPATSLYIETGVRQDDVGLFAEEIRDAAMRIYSGTLEHGLARLHEAWTKENYLAGRDVTIRLSDGRGIFGTVVDFSMDGALVMINRETSEVLEILSGDLIRF